MTDKLWIFGCSNWRLFLLKNQSADISLLGTEISNMTEISSVVEYSSWRARTPHKVSYLKSSYRFDKRGFWEDFVDFLTFASQISIVLYQKLGISARGFWLIWFRWWWGFHWCVDELFWVGISSGAYLWRRVVHQFQGFGQHVITQMKNRTKEWLVSCESSVVVIDVVFYTRINQHTFLW